MSKVMKIKWTNCHHLEPKVVLFFLDHTDGHQTNIPWVRVTFYDFPNSLYTLNPCWNVDIIRVFKWSTFQLTVKNCLNVSFGLPLKGAGVLKRFLFLEVLPRGPNPYPIIYYFRQIEKVTPFVYLSHINSRDPGSLLIFLSNNPFLKILQQYLPTICWVCSRYFESS